MLLWMMLALKIPIGALGYLVYWASRAPETDDQTSEPARLPADPTHPRSPRWPTPPRRGPHAEPLPPRSPKRVRAHAKRLTRSH